MLVSPSPSRRLLSRRGVLGGDGVPGDPLLSLDFIISGLPATDVGGVALLD